MGFVPSLKILELERQCDKFAQHIGILSPVLYDIYEPCTGYIVFPEVYFGTGRAKVLVRFHNGGLHMMEIQYLKYKISDQEDWITFDELMALP